MFESWYACVPYKRGRREYLTGDEIYKIWQGYHSIKKILGQDCQNHSMLVVLQYTTKEMLAELKHKRLIFILFFGSDL